MPNKTFAIPRSVSFTDNNDDWKVCQLIQAGFSTRAIQAVTGLTYSQINYRAHKSGLKRAMYRDAKGRVAQEMLYNLDHFWTEKQARNERTRIERRRKEIMREVRAKAAQKRKNNKLRQKKRK